ncbi:glycosyltransferase family A protein [Qipengyuania sp.]|uniref:glycosyltransferase family A protein n=1 Tax=Qipengyuania sp. TaxID=2004515 RepID=UPI0035C816B9
MTVIIPTYGRSEMLASSIDSVMAQSVVPRILVVDDGSEPPAKLHRTDPRLSLHRLAQNAGGARARNVGVDQASTPWITFLDDDDEWLSGSGALYDVMLPDEPQADLCYVSGLEVVSADGDKLEQRNAHSRQKGDAWFLEHTPPGSSHLTKQTFVMPAALFRRIGGFDTGLESRIHSEFALRLNGAAAIEAIDRTTYRLRKHGGAQVSKMPGKRHRGFLHIWRKHEAIIKAHPDGGARWAHDHARRLFQENRPSEAIHALWLAFQLNPMSLPASFKIIGLHLRKYIQFN